MDARRVVLSCEHASNRVPAGMDLGVSRAVLESHVAWDIGAAEVARDCGRTLRRPPHLGRWSRLVVDLNRSLRHPRLIARVTCGVRVPGNEGLSPDGRRRRVERYWAPYREHVAAHVAAAMRRGGCLHVSLHSFTPVLGEVRRSVDVGLLYDPSRPREAAFAGLLLEALAPSGLRARRNQPYRGTADGFTTRLRKTLPPDSYSGVEIEINQALLPAGPARRRIARIVAGALGTAVAAHRA